MTTKPIASLQLDETIWPRGSIVAANVAAIAEAMRLGETMPPIVIDRKTSKVVDGFHRIRAAEKLYGPTYAIPVEARSYPNRQAMVADAIRLNVGRGADLTSWDIARCLMLAEEVGLDLPTLAGLLKWRPEKLVKYRDTRLARTDDDRKLMLKRSIRHKLNQPLTPAQEHANEQLSGMNPMFHANQLVTLLETDLFPDDDHLAARLAHLAHLIAGWLDERHHPDTDNTAEGA